MKKLFFLIANLLIINYISTAQSVTLGTTTVNPTKGTVVYNNGTNQLQYWNGTAWIPITNAASGTGWALNGTHIYSSNTGNVGVGTTSPVFPLTVIANGASKGITQESEDGITKIGFYTANGGGAYVQTHTNHDLKFATNNDGADMVLQKATGYLGIGTGSPVNKLQIGSMGSSGFAGNQIAIGDGTNAMGIYQSSVSTSVAATTDIVLKPRNNLAGYVGINVNTPTNQLQIGSVGASGFASNQFALGNGVGAMAIFQSNASTLIGSNTDIILRPRNNGNGQVGINTTTPRGPLDVTSWSNTAAMPFAYFRASDIDGHAIVNETPSATASVSIYAEQSILASQFVAISDARIKNVIGISNSAKDLETIKGLQITDYTMKDKMQHGYKPFKKVIAQQVEQVYPQAVSTVTDVVPDIYALADKVVFDELNKSLTISLSGDYKIQVGEKLELIHFEKGKVKVMVQTVNGNSFTVKDWQYPTDKIFVYGREVNDFRSVDYEAISMLGISAIQQLAKENLELTHEIQKLKANSQQLNARLEAIENMIVKPQTGK